jgi:hypothetical protein
MRRRSNLPIHVGCLRPLRSFGPSFLPVYLPSEGRYFIAGASFLACCLSQTFVEALTLTK